jgi:hypothetical protein
VVVCKTAKNGTQQDYVDDHADFDLHPISVQIKMGFWKKPGKVVIYAMTALQNLK